MSNPKIRYDGITETGEAGSVFQEIIGVTDGAAHVDASPGNQLVAQSDTVSDPSGPFIGMRFDASGTVSILGTDGVTSEINALAGEYWPSPILRINSTGTSLFDAQMVGFKRT